MSNKGKNEKPKGDKIGYRVKPLIAPETMYRETTYMVDGYFYFGFFPLPQGSIEEERLWLRNDNK